MTSADEVAGATPAPTLDLGDRLEAAARDVARRLRARREEIWRASARFRPQRCRSCNAELAWCLTESAARPQWIPLSAPQSGMTGNVATVRDGATRVAVVNPEPDVPGPFLRAHFADCPNASRYRRR